MAGLRDVMAGKAAPFALTEQAAARIERPVAVDTIGPRSEQAEYWRKTDRERRESSGWASEQATT
jgi:hypothetical protein